MDGLSKLRALSARLNRQPDHVLQNETVRNALVLSFIHALGYNVFDRSQVVPKYAPNPARGAGDGPGTPELVDYAILQNGQPVILMDCRDNRAFPRLFRELKPVVGVRTDGIVYRIFSDVERPHRMDGAPFMEVDLRNLDSVPMSALMKLGQSQFDPDSVWEIAKELRYSREIRRLLVQQRDDPADDFVKFFACRMCPLVFHRRDREQFVEIVRRALQDLVGGPAGVPVPAATELRQLEPTA